MKGDDLLEASYTSLLDALAVTGDADAWSPTRCRGWSVQDLVHHLQSDAARALVALHSPSSVPPDTDEVSYWRSWRPQPGGGDADLRHTRILASVWTFRPLVEHYVETAHAVIVASNARPRHDVITTQGKSMTVGTLRSTLAVEATVHQLDLGLGVPAPQGLAEVRRVLDGLLGSPAPIADDTRYALVGTGREPLTAEESARLGSSAGLLPLFG